MSESNKLINKQKNYWNKNFTDRLEMFGTLPSFAGKKAVSAFHNKKCTNIIELGAGQGRDTIYFLKKNFKITALDYSNIAINQILKKTKSFKNFNNLKVKCHDIRLKLPFDNNSIDGCFSHMLYCMAFSFDQLKFLSSEIHRVLKPGGLNIYSVRNHNDGDFKNGKLIAKNIYQNDGFIVHFFSLDTINQLSMGYEILDITSFEEGKFPRKLYLIIEKKI